MSFLIRTLRLKVKPDDYAWLNAAAREVNDYADKKMSIALGCE